MHDNTMYLVSPFPDILFALDLTKPGATVKWSYQPKPSPSSQGVACCDVVNRGAAYFNGRIYYNTLDLHTVAIDASSHHHIRRAVVGPSKKRIVHVDRNT